MKRNDKSILRPAGVLLAGLFFGLGTPSARGAGVPLGPARNPVGRLAQAPAPRPPPPSVDRPKIELQAAVQIDDNGLPSSIHGTLIVRNWQTDGGAHCLYVPYADAG